MSVLISCLLIILGDIRDLGSLITGTDYLEFYTTGDMARTGHLDQLYLPEQATEMGNASQMAYAMQMKQLDPKACGRTTIVFSYPALVALMFAPLSLLSFKNSLIAWQILSLAALFLSCFLFSKIKNESSQKRPAVFFLVSFTLLHVVQALVLGQTTFVLALLPWVAAMFFLSRQKPVLAGLCLSLLSMKPQIFLSAACVGAALVYSGFLERRQKGDALALRIAITACAAAALGTALLQFTPMLVEGDLLSRWLHQVHLLNNHLYGPKEYLYTTHGLSSLWSTIAMATPLALRAALRAPAQIASFATMVVQLILMFRIAKYSHLSQIDKLNYLSLIAVIFLPVAALYLCSYDLTMFLLPGWIVLSYSGKPEVKPLCTTMLIVLIILDVFWLAMPFTVTHGIVQSTMVLEQLILVAACLFVSLTLTKMCGAEKS